MSDSVTVVTPVGRLIAGNVWEAQTKNYDGSLMVDRNGQPAPRYKFQLAIEKSNPDWPAFYQQLQQVAQRDFPQGEWQRPDFSWKLIDGDRPDVATRVGCAGHHIVRFNSVMAPQVVKDGGKTVLNNPDQLKKGDYIRAVASIRGNGSQKSPGLYINGAVVEFMGFGERIQSGPDASALLNSAPKPGYMPQGMSQTPLAGPAVPAMPTQPQAPVGYGAPQPQPQAPVGYGAPQAPVPDYNALNPNTYQQ